MAKSKIEWTDYTWNPVWGCNAGCDYCYARGVAKRFAETMVRAENEFRNIDPELAEMFFDNKVENVKNFRLVLFEHQLYKDLPRKPKKIFIGSMSDIAFWKTEWLYELAIEIRRYPQHTFQLLTKYPKVYEKLDALMPKNVWFGVTITKTDELNKAVDLLMYSRAARKRYISFEPVLENIQTKTLFGAGLTDWVIVGAMSGKSKSRTKTGWIGNIVAQAKKYHKPVFVKQIEVNGKIEKDINKFPMGLRYREFPTFNFGEENG